MKPIKFIEDQPQSQGHFAATATEPTGSKKIPTTLLVGDNLHLAISEKTEVLWLLVVIFPHSHDLSRVDPQAAPLH